MGPFNAWSALAQFGQAQPEPGSPDPMVARQEGLDGGHGNDGNRSRMGMARPGAPTWRGMNWADRLTALGAIVGDLDPRSQGQNFAGFREEFSHRGDAERERAKAEQEAARRQQFQQAYQASLGPDGQLDARKFAQLTSGLGLVDDLAGVASMARLTAPQDDPLQFGDIDGNGVADVFRRSQGEAYVDAHALGSPGAPLGQPRPGTPSPHGLPPLPPGLTLVNPSQAAPVRAATPQGQGFGNYGALRGFVAEQVPGSRFTSGYRSQATQDDLVRRGVTSATRSEHTYGMGQDIVPPVPFSQWEAVAEQLRATGRFRLVKVETGKGRNQGTAPHIHLEPIR